MTYVIDFDSPRGSLLHRDGQRVAHACDDAMTFDDQETALQYIEKNRAALDEIGKGAAPSRLK